MQQQQQRGVTPSVAYHHRHVSPKEHFMSSCLSTYLIIYLSDNLFMQVESSKLVTLEKTYKAQQSKHEQQMSVLLGQVRVERREIESSREELVRCQQLIRNTVAQMASQRDDLQCQVESLKAMQQVMVTIDGWVDDFFADKMKSDFILEWMYTLMDG
jgi:hypothetical protein